MNQNVRAVDKTIGKISYFRSLQRCKQGGYGHVHLFPFQHSNHAIERSILCLGSPTTVNAADNRVLESKLELKSIPNVSRESGHVTVVLNVNEWKIL